MLLNNINVLSINVSTTKIQTAYYNNSDKKSNVILTYYIIAKSAEQNYCHTTIKLAESLNLITLKLQDTLQFMYI